MTIDTMTTTMTMTIDNNGDQDVDNNDQDDLVRQCIDGLSKVVSEIF